MKDDRTVWARIKAQLLAGQRPARVADHVDATPPPRAVVREPEMTVGPGVDWDQYDRTRVLRLCACRRPHRRCDECSQFVCTQKPHHCPAAVTEAAS